MEASVSAKASERVNPGPSWGYAFISFLERVSPGWFFGFILSIGTLVGMLCMGRQRRHSRDYHEALFGKKPGLRQQFRQFRAFMDALVIKLQAGRGVLPRFEYLAEADKGSFEQLMASGQQAFMGTFHVGYSDMMGCMLKTFDRRISLIRLRVGNSMDTDVLQKLFGDMVRFLWINEPDEFIFRLKQAVDDGETIGIQCDRTEFSSRTDVFEFLGARRRFPTTIYHMANLFKLPVAFAFTGRRSKDGVISVYTSPIYRPVEDRVESLKSAHAHFQGVLSDLERHLQQYPELWFNFLPLNERVEKEQA